MYINIGCGNKRYENTLNVDVVDNEFTDVDVVANIKCLPFEDNSVDGIIAEHVLEHTIKQEHEYILFEWKRVLKDGGKLYVEVPDFDMCLKNYLDNYLGMKDYWYNTIYGRNLYESDRHLSGIGEMYLTDLLFSVGFVNLEWIKSDRERACLGVMATNKKINMGFRWQA